jgi:DNA replication protein DnaC
MLALLGTGNYVDKGESVLITGAAGVGKSYLATALGNKACNQGYKVNYFNMQKLLGKLRLARVDGTIIKLITKISKVDLLIIDDFGMKVLEGQQQNDFMEIIEDRHGRKATIIASQLPVSKWYDVIGNEVIADAILDRIVHSSHRFDLKGESLRKKL